MTVGFSSVFLAFQRLVSAADVRHKRCYCGITMKNNSFDLAMDKIVGQAHAEQARELKVQQRQKEMAKIRNIGLSLAGAAVLAVVLYNGAALQSLMEDKLASKKPVAVNGATSDQLDKIQQTAEKRDAIVSEITK